MSKTIGLGLVFSVDLRWVQREAMSRVIQRNARQFRPLEAASALARSLRPSSAATMFRVPPASVREEQAGGWYPAVKLPGTNGAVDRFGKRDQHVPLLPRSAERRRELRVRRWLFCVEKNAGHRGRS